MDAVTTPPAPRNEPVRSLRAGQRRARPRWRPRLKELAGERVELTDDRSAASSGWPAASRSTSSSRTGTRPCSAVTADVRPTRTWRAAVEAALAAGAGVARPAVRRAGGGLPAGRRAAGRAVAGHPQRGDDARASRRPSYQAEIDAACELIDFLRFNVHFGRQVLAEQPRLVAGRVEPDGPPPAGGLRAARSRRSTSPRSPATCRSRPALMGNTVVWKPSPTQQLAAHFTMRLLEAAGLPPGVINMVTGDGRAVSEVALAAPGTWPASTSPARPRPSSSSGRPSAATSTATAPTRGWSARPAARTSSSRTRAPTRPRCAPRWSAARSSTRGRSARPPRGRTCRGRCGRAGCATGSSPTAESLDVRRRHRPVATSAARSSTAGRSTGSPACSDRIAIDGLHGCSPAARADDSDGLLRPADGRASAPTRRTRCSPPSTSGRSSACYVYDDADCRRGAAPRPTDVAPYALTGSVFATDRARGRRGRRERCASRPATSTSTTSRPARSSGSSRSAAPGPAAPTTRPARCLNLLRWVSPRTIKETFVPPTDHRYPHLG